LYTDQPGENFNALDLFEIAAKFKVQQIKTSCEEIVIDYIKDFPAIEALKLGNVHGSDIVVDAAFNEIQLMYPDLKFDERLKKNPDRVTKMIETKQNYHKAMKALNS